MVSGADLFKGINELKKRVRELENRAELAMINRDSLLYKLKEAESRLSRYEKFLLLLSVINFLTIILLGV